jgi:putative ABC transport system permease protein
MITKLSWRNIWFKPLSTFLSILLLASSIAIITLLILLQKQFEEQFSSNADNIDLVLGAQGSPLQLILSSVYQVDAPTGNINYDSAKVWMKHPFVQSAIPLAFGDNYLGYKIVGTTPEYLSKFKATIKEGKLFQKNFEVVVGSQIARKLNLKLGDSFFGTHGDAKEGELHDQHKYQVVGIATATGKVIDNLIVCNIESVWEMHDTHDHNHEQHEHSSECTHETTPKEITSVVLKFRNKMAIMTWPRIIGQNTKMQAVSPAIEINRLFALFGIGLQTLRYLALGIMLLSGISIFVSLYNRLKERKYEFALLRLQGASRFQLLQLVVLESLFLCLVGYFFGTIIGRFALQILSSASQDDFKLGFNPLEIVWSQEGTLLLLTLLVGIISAIIPAIKAYKMNISKTLANG